MADRLYTQVGRLYDSYDKRITALASAHEREAWGLWSSLSPADWWNDGVTQGYASRLAYKDMLRVSNARRLGQSSSAGSLKMLGNGSVDAFDSSWVPTRANTDAVRIQLKPVEQYRHMAMQSPMVKPLEWPKPTEADWDLVNSWLDSAQQRLDTVTDTDMTRAGDDGSRETLKRAGVTHYRRLIHPELSSTGSCGLCVAAATRVYSVSNPKPLHDHCHCTVMPITGSHDPGEYLNNLDLDKLYRKAGGTSAADLAKLHVQVTEHGELGPILNDKGKLADDTSYNVRSGWQQEHRQSYSPPDADTAKAELESMLKRAEILQKAMLKVAEGNLNAYKIDVDGRELYIKESKSLKRAIRYQAEFAKQLRAMLGMAA